MSEKFLGQIFMTGFNFAPQNAALCNGQIIGISQNTALFSLLGTTYGGNGTSTFQLPDLRSRTPAGFSTIAGDYTLGTQEGDETVSLTGAENGPHNHLVPATSATGSTDITPGGLAFAATPASSTPLYGPGQRLISLSAVSVSAAGGGQPHDNRQPYLGISFCIVLSGTFPPRN